MFRPARSLGQEVVIKKKRLPSSHLTSEVRPSLLEANTRDAKVGWGRSIYMTGMICTEGRISAAL